MKSKNKDIRHLEEIAIYQFKHNRIIRRELRDLWLYVFLTWLINFLLIFLLIFKK